ncbi:MAG TPA: hypothetical protein ENO24_07060 [Chloroflexi bacterium]|nr:hypothetical protein [Chloroflexota bacterium]
MLGKVTTRVRDLYQKHQDFFLLALLFASFRFLALLLFEPGGYVLDWSGYYVPGASFVELSDWGYYPVVHYWMEYPPLFPWLSVIVYRVSMLLPLWRVPELWYNLLLGSVFLLFEVGNFALIYAIALQLRGREGALRCAWIYAGLFFPLMTLLFWFENLPLFFLLLGVYMIIRKRPVWAGVAAGVGFMIKFVPALVAPTALRVLPKTSHRLIYTLTALLVVLLIALPFLLTNATFFMVPFLHLGSIGPWQTIWAFLDGYYWGGETTPLETRFDATAITTTFHQTSLPYLLVALLFVAIFLVLYTRPVDWQDDTKAVAFCGLTIALFLIFSKGYSPQWIINLLPFIVLLMPNLRGITYSLLLMGVNVVEFPVALILLAQHPWVFVLAVILRTVLLVLVGVELGLVLFPTPRAKRYMGLSLAGLVVLLLALSLPLSALAIRDYTAERYEENAYREAMDHLARQPVGGVIFTDQKLYHQLYGFLVRRHGLYLLDANDHLPVALARLTDRHQPVYVLYTGSEDDLRVNPAVEEWLSQNAFPVGIQWLGNARVSQYSTPASGLQESPTVATFADQIELVSCAFEAQPVAAEGTLHVRLTWSSLAVMDDDYTVFVHLTGQDGHLWAQHDSQPGGGWLPTSSWQPGERFIDNHGLALPRDMPAGEYQLAVGLYDASTGQRLMVEVPGQEGPTDTVVVAPVHIAPPGT